MLLNFEKQSTFKLVIMRKKILVWLTHSLGMPYFKIFRKRNNFQYDMDGLSQFEDGSVGKKLYCFLQQNGLNLLPYYEKHDIKHVLLNYPPTELGEIQLQCFMWANGRKTFPVFIAVLFGFLTMPEYWHQFKEAYNKGAQNKPLANVEWFDLLPFSLHAVRQILLQPKQNN